MAVTQAQIDLGKRCYDTLTALEAEHQSRQVVAHHHALNDLLTSFQPELAPSDYTAMGGGVPKTQ